MPVFCFEIVGSRTSSFETSLALFTPADGRHGKTLQFLGSHEMGVLAFLYELRRSPFKVSFLRSD